MTRSRLGLAALLVVLAIVAVWLLRSGKLDERSSVALSETRQDSIRATLFTALQPVALSNCQLERLGEPHDGGYLVCGNLLDSVEAAYSYGIAGYDQWGCDVATRLNVRLHEYDCFDTRVPACPEANRAFHAECIGQAAGVFDGRPFDTLSNQIARNGDGAKRLIVKMDVEGTEWDSFLYAPDSVLEHIDQLVVEFHHVQEERFLAAVPDCQGDLQVAGSRQ